MAAAVTLGALVGPSQVLARVLEMIAGRRFHPIWTMFSSTVLVTTGLVLLSFHFPVVALGLVFFGTGMGIMSIARGTVPLVVFGAAGYAVLMGNPCACNSLCALDRRIFSNSGCRRTFSPIPYATISIGHQAATFLNRFTKFSSGTVNPGFCGGERNP
jgi:hypothetical protein